MPDQPYSDEDVELVVRALFRAMYGEETKAALADFPEYSPFLSQARAVLDVLASAGRLVPPGSQVREEYSAELTYNDGSTSRPHWSEGPSGLSVAKDVTHSPLNWQEPGEVGQVVRRRIITTPPTPVEES